MDCVTQRSKTGVYVYRQSFRQIFKLPQLSKDKHKCLKNWLMCGMYGQVLHKFLKINFVVKIDQI